jgi:acetyl-CoA carboxylase carboxyl transferase subunit beta
MSWFKRKIEGITTSTSEKKSVPDGLWHKCPRCKKAILSSDHAANQYVCSSCNYHDKIGSLEYFQILFW